MSSKGRTQSSTLVLSLKLILRMSALLCAPLGGCIIKWGGLQAYWQILSLIVVCSQDSFQAKVVTLSCGIMVGGGRPFLPYPHWLLLKLLVTEYSKAA